MAHQEDQERQVKMGPRDQLDHQEHVEIEDHKELLETKEKMAYQDLKEKLDLPDPKDQMVMLETVADVGRRETPDSWDTKEKLDQ